MNKGSPIGHNSGQEPCHVLKLNVGSKKKISPRHEKSKPRKVWKTSKYQFGQMNKHLISTQSEKN